MDESAMLAHIYRASTGVTDADHVLVGPGDDCAVLAGTPPQLITVDQTIVGRHVDVAASPADIGWKAVARAVSDIAAMGGTPTSAVVAAAIPPMHRHADKVFDHARNAAAELGCPLVGGDISATDGPLTLAVTVLGLAHPTRGPVLRTAAEPGQSVYVTGALGGAVTSARHLRVQPRIEQGIALCDTLAHQLGAMIDLSDGLGRDTGRIAEASGVRIVIEGARVPIHSDATCFDAAVREGEDYELCFTAEGDVPAEVCGIAITRIGAVEIGAGCVLVEGDGRERSIGELGFNHGG